MSLGRAVGTPFSSRASMLHSFRHRILVWTLCSVGASSGVVRDARRRRLRCRCVLAAHPSLHLEAKATILACGSLRSAIAPPRPGPQPAALRRSSRAGSCPASPPATAHRPPDQSRQAAEGCDPTDHPEDERAAQPAQAVIILGLRLTFRLGNRSGKEVALPPPPPLRTGRESSPSSSSSIHERPSRDAAASVRPSCTWICR